jgi:hypothetical protein
MDPADRVFLRDFFRSVSFHPLDPEDPRYVRIYDDRRIADADPVELMARAIEWTPGQSVQLFSGFRGTGKSTELRRLRKRLIEAGYLVVLCDVEDYVNLSIPVDVSDFLMALAGVFGDQLRAEDLLGEDAARESYWERLVAFLTRTKVGIDGISAQAGALDVKATLKSDPTFKQRLQERMAGHLGALVEDVRSYVKECVNRLKDRHGVATEVVLLVDSVEHIRGTSTNASAVQASVESLFTGHADKLHLPNLHLVYTVPPYLTVRYPNLGVLYAPGGVKVLPAVKVHEGPNGEASRPGLEALQKVVRARGDWEKLLGEREVLDRLGLQSGGHLRDLLRLVAEILLRAQQLPVPEAVVAAALTQIRSEFLPIADDDALWLARVAATHDTALATTDKLPDLARFLDTHLVLCYKNGDFWYDVHPLIADHVQAQAARLAAERPAPAG